MKFELLASCTVCLQMFHELLKLIKADRKRRQNLQEPSPKAAAATAVNSREKPSPSNGGGVKRVPEGLTSTKRLGQKKTRKTKPKKTSGRRRRARRGLRSVRRTVRRVCRRIATCRVMWRHRQNVNIVIEWRHVTWPIVFLCRRVMSCRNWLLIPLSLLL